VTHSRPDCFDAHEQRIRVAIHAHLANPQHVAAGFALLPELIRERLKNTTSPVRCVSASDSGFMKPSINTSPVRSSWMIAGSSPPLF